MFKNIIKIIIIFYILSFSIFSAKDDLKVFPDESIYNLDILLTDRHNNNIHFSNLSNHIQIFSMIYINCKTICPIIISNMKTIEKLLNKNFSEKVKFSLITLDPERDDINSINNFFHEKKFNDNWSIYRCNKNDVLKIALSTGIKFKKDYESNDYIHSNLIILIDRNGVVKHYHQGLDKDFDEILKIIYNLSH